IGPCDRHRFHFFKRLDTVETRRDLRLFRPPAERPAELIEAAFLGIQQLQDPLLALRRDRAEVVEIRNEHLDRDGDRHDVRCADDERAFHRELRRDLRAKPARQLASYALGRAWRRTAHHYEYLDRASG